MSAFGAAAAKEIIDFALTVMQAAPALIQAGADVKELLSLTGDSLKKMQDEDRGPLPEEWDAMNQMLAVLREEFHAPEPPQA